MRFTFSNLEDKAARILNKTGDNLEFVTSSRQLSAYYFVALLAIGCITLTSHVAEQRSLERGQGTAATINLSGRQRMLSQRIESLAEQYHRGDMTARTEMVVAINAFERAHGQLSRNYVAAAGTGSSYQSLHDIYFAGANSLDGAVRTYIRDARKVSDLPPNDPAIPDLLAAMSSEARFRLLTGLEAVVKIHQKASEDMFARLQTLQRVLLAIMGATLTLEALLIFRPLVRRIVKLSIYLLHQATLDPLTGVNNRRGFTERATIEFHRFQRYRRPVSVIAADVDHFKRINDSFGHEAGDAVLKAIAATLASSIRPTDILGRMGGEEFTLVLPETSLENAVILAERIRRAVETLQIEYQSNTISVTSSFGVTALLPDSPGIEPALDMADKLLYLAKREGRNRVIWQDSPEHREVHSAVHAVPTFSHDSAENSGMKLS